MKFITLALLVNLAWPCALNAAENTFVWPHNAKAAVSLGYDDALTSQLENAVPLLNKLQLKGSFYLPVSYPTVSSRLEEWRKLARDGHELGNHSIFHQCSGSLSGRQWVKPELDLDKISLSQMRDQVLVANGFLHAIDGKNERTYTPPCLDVNAGGQNYIAAITQYFVAIKGQGSGVVPNMATLNPYAVGVNFPADVTGEQLIAIVKEAAAKGTMASFTFHGVGGDYLSVSKEAHEKLLQYLAANKDIYWTDTFINIMKYVKTQRAAPSGF